jgi:hypothetical protein
MVGLFYVVANVKGQDISLLIMVAVDCALELCIKSITLLRWFSENLFILGLALVALELYFIAQLEIKDVPDADVELRTLKFASLTAKSIAENCRH